MDITVMQRAAKVRIGSRVGNWVVLRRNGMYRPGKPNSEHKFDAQCVHCGAVRTKRLCHFRNTAFHRGCPMLNQKIVHQGAYKTDVSKVKKYIDEQFVPIVKR